ncbi:hypothetical protein DET49_11349 [Salegentibacter sp. 24]|uniref:hypothetical protein n=1 Tax=Salegentibacter sp. 24 TaxID=2183986 RepID=UPI00105F8373|nr:hypothetical protein [Salegentibacter sp. 24]TDN87190.1 hypothetical protein DET49_11349 [Salegentibacter sp. 24]
MKYFLFAFLLCFSFIVNAQEKQILTGIIEADSIEAPVHIINLSQEKGSVSDKAGNFKIEVTASDRLLISSVQFQRKEIEVTEKMLGDKFLRIKLQPALTELEQVRVHNLSGNLGADIATIKVVDMPVISVPPTGYTTSPGTPNAAFNASQTQAPTGGNILGLVGLIAGKPNFGTLGKTDTPVRAEEQVVNRLRNKFDDYFFTNHLNIDSSHIWNFLSYIFENGFQKRLLEKDRSLELIVYLEKKSREYLDFIENK